MPRRAQTSTPPKTASDILANATNSAIRLGGVDVGDSGIAGAGTATGANPRARSRLRTAAPQGQPVFIVFHPKGGCFRPKRPPQALFFSTFAPYIGGAGSPAMEIKCRRNKPFGPGGSTRRLHPSPPASAGFGGGETGSTRAQRACFFSVW